MLAKARAQVLLLVSLYYPPLWPRVGFDLDSEDWFGQFGTMILRGLKCPNLCDKVIRHAQLDAADAYSRALEGIY